MRDRRIERQFRWFLLMLSGCICVGTVVELLLAEHTESTVQWIPFVLCGLGGGVVAVALYAPQRRVLFLLRGAMGIVALGSFYGIYEHVAHNVAFELEIRPTATIGDVFWDALHGGSPLLAPGILALAAVLALAATYEHPALVRDQDEWVE